MSGSRDFGKIINERRLSLGYSLGQLANRMGTTATKVRSWERGDAEPDDATLQQLADELNMSSDVLRATLPERDPLDDATDDDATAAIAGLVFSDAADTAAAELDEHPDSALVAEPVDVESDLEEAPDHESASGDEPEHDDEPDLEPEPEPADDEPEQDDEPEAHDEPDQEDEVDPDEPTAVVAATLAAGDDASSSDEGEFDQHDGDADDPERAETHGTAEAESEEPDMRIVDLPTEAVPVVPSVAASLPPSPAAEPSPALVASSAALATAPPPARMDPNDLGIPEPSGLFAPVEQFMAKVFDPDKNYLVWIRLVLILIVFFVFLRVLAWAVPEFFDALKDILDTIESTPTEVDPATEFIEG